MAADTPAPDAVDWLHEEHGKAGAGMGGSGVGRFGGRVWDDLGLAPGLLDVVAPAKPVPYLPSRLAVTELACDSVALSALALHLVSADRAGTESVAPVGLDGDRIAASFQSDRHLRIAGEKPDVWAPLSGFWRASDGWVRTHANYPHHERALRAVLGTSEETPGEEVVRLIAKRSAAELEDKAAEVGAILVAVRREATWRAHPQARALEGQPLMRVSTRPEGEPRGWTEGDGRPLAGVRVLDLTRVIAGPVAARDLAFAGADVLRVDSPALPEIPWQHLDTGHGKRTTVLDLRARADRATFDDLLARADVLVTGYRPGSLAAFGLAPEDVLDRFPGLVVGTVSAWGETGPWASRRGFDSIVQAASGIALTESPDGHTPGALPAQALDHATGHFLAAALTASLLRQRTEGGSHHVSTSLARLALTLLTAPSHTEPSAPPARPAPTQTVTTPLGPLTTATPAFTYANSATTYPAPHPWSSNPATWP
ncbi:CoA transferase [Actinocorallia sp. API 0066]|uniref:CoA transferase n=1 Tax=Actinocorallia sp. API 0066 TaxID=2896846 RepID=UPI001E4B182A|nr:CoA transferase [Actinocorallia sp. API 0066]MCD0452065.1 CoA transferase [Actinocorallia sp. API 0066]